MGDDDDMCMYQGFDMCDNMSNDGDENFHSSAKESTGLDCHYKTNPLFGYDTFSNIPGRWTREEHLLFIKGLEIYGKGWKKIAGLIKTRTVVQIRTHAQKYFLKLTKARQSGDSGGNLSMDGKTLGPAHRKVLRDSFPFITLLIFFFFTSSTEETSTALG